MMKIREQRVWVGLYNIYVTQESTANGVHSYAEVPFGKGAINVYSMR
jgi:hypothetical protein